MRRAGASIALCARRLACAEAQRPACLTTAAHLARVFTASPPGPASSALPCTSGCGPSTQPRLGVPVGVGQLRGMFIQTQPTPNPQSLMFVPGKAVMESGSQEYGSARAAMASPLARRLFAVDGVSGVFFGSDFITITKQEDSSWAVLKPQVFAAIMDHYASGEPVLGEAGGAGASDTAIHPDDDEVVAMIKELLETRIRPAVQEDGGDIVFKEWDVDSGTVYLKMMGACSGCPSSSVTLKSGIENMLLHYIPEVKQVLEAPPDEAEEESVKAFNALESHLSA